MADFEGLRAKLADGDSAYGVVVSNGGAASAELVALTGFDFAWIDMEHTSMGFREVESLITAVAARNCVPAVRVPWNEVNHISRVLELGAEIVIVPHVDTVADAEAAVFGAKYFPLGRRGFTSAVRSNKFGLEPLDVETMARKNSGNMLMVQIESERAMDNLADIARVEGVDSLFLALGDLGQDMGISTQYDHPRMVDAIKHFSEAVAQTDKLAATAMLSRDKLSFFQELNFRVFSCAVDTNLMRNALQELMRRIQSPSK